MSGAVECQLCHQPVTSAYARARRIGSRCWRKLRPDQRAAISSAVRSGQSAAAAARAALTQPAPAGDGQLPLDQQEIHDEQ